jgi:hypothetical protein
MVLGNYAERGRGKGGGGAPPDATPSAAALVAKAREGGGYNVYSAGNALPSALFTALARSAGAHIFSEHGSECGVQASGNALFIHAIGPSERATRGGGRLVTLPKPLRVRAENGSWVCEHACGTFVADLAAGHSELFTVEDEKEPRRREWAI